MEKAKRSTASPKKVNLKKNDEENFWKTLIRYLILYQKFYIKKSTISRYSPPYQKKIFHSFMFVHRSV